MECPGNSTCVDEVNSYTCQEDCRSVTCPNNSICVQTERTTGDYECICDSGFSQQDDKCIQSEDVFTTMCVPIIIFIIVFISVSTTAIEPGTDVPVNRDRPQVAPATVGTVVAVVVISVAIGILIVMLIVVILLKRRKSKSYNQYPGRPLFYPTERKPEGKYIVLSPADLTTTMQWRDRRCQHYNLVA